MGDKIAAKEAMAEAGVPLVPGLGRGRRPRPGARGGCRGGLPGAAQGLGGRRRARHAPRRVRRRARCGLPHGVLRGTVGLRRRLSLRREGGRRRAPCGDPGARGRGGSGSHARRARLLDPAPAPEARRGVALAGRHARDPRRDGRSRPSGLRSPPLPGRGHHRVSPRRRRPLLLHRDEHAAPGRASRDRARHRHRPRPRPARGRGRGRPSARGPARTCEATRSSFGSTPRTRPRTSGRRPAAYPASGRRSARACAWTRTSRRAMRSRPSTTP